LIIKLIPFLIFISSCLAGVATQTDWSGGDNYYGPTTDWTNKFLSETSIVYADYPGEISLAPLSLIIDNSSYRVNTIYSEDFDNDGDMDILGAVYYENVIAWWENTDGVGNGWTRHNVGHCNTAAAVYSQDIDGDNDLDILGVGCWADSVCWWENNGNGTSWTEHTIDDNFDSATFVYSEDIDSDGDMDVLGASSDHNCIIWWENKNGAGTSWDIHMVCYNLTHVQSIYPEDIDKDGDIDILSASFYSPDIAWWENNNGAGTSWTEHTIDDNYDAARCVHSADIDGDGDMDVVGAAFFDDIITWWETSDTAPGIIWTKHYVCYEFDGAKSIHSQDLDNDGDIDIIGAAFYDDKITWWENDDGTGTSWTQHTIQNNSNSASSVYAADINGDGNINVLGTWDYNITWWDIHSYSAESNLESSILNTNEPADWLNLNWTGSKPIETSIGIQVRSSDDYISGMGEWSDTLFSPGSLSGILTDGDRYFQYKVILITADSTVTPILNDISITWEEYTTTEHGTEVQLENYSLFGAKPNPASGTANICFELPLSSQTTLTIFDIAGRVVGEISADYQIGTHQEMFSNLTPGVYHVIMEADNFSAIKQFVVIE